MHRAYLLAYKPIINNGKKDPVHEYCGIIEVYRTLVHSFAQRYGKLDVGRYRAGLVVVEVVTSDQAKEGVDAVGGLAAFPVAESLNEIQRVEVAAALAQASEQLHGPDAAAQRIAL